MHGCGVLADRRAGPGRGIHAPRRIGRCWPWLLLALLAPGHTPAEPALGERAPFELPVAKVRLVDEVYRLDAVARLRLTADVRAALHNGVDLSLAWEASIQRVRAWWPDAEVAYITQRYRLSFHELSLQYIVTNLNTGQRRSYSQLSIALERIGTLFGFPLIDRVLVEGGAQVVGRVRVRLQQDELPLPLRAVALFDGDWDLATEWYRWQFE